MSDVQVHHGDCIDVLRSLPDCSVDAVVTDPPYGLGFMGKEWDKIKQEKSRPPSADETDARFNNKFPRTGKGPAATAFDGVAFQLWCQEWTAECLRVLKPGGHLLAFGGTRTWHRLACAVEDAGFEVRDSIAWLYGSGFPKSLDVSKAIDKAAGATREVVGVKTYPDGTPRRLTGLNPRNDEWARPWESDPDAIRAKTEITAPATPDAARWQGWGTALKPAFEPVVVARKPLTGTVAANVLAHGTGALNIDACRIGDELITAHGGGSTGGHRIYNGDKKNGQGIPAIEAGSNPRNGRWPANVVLDEWTEPVLRLRYNLNPSVERVIRESYGANTDHLPAVQDTNAGVTEQGGAHAVLPTELLRAVDGGEPDGREGPSLAHAAHAGNEGEDRTDTEDQRALGAEQSAVDRGKVPESRLRDGSGERAERGRPGDVRVDADRDGAAADDSGAPVGGGSDDGAPAAVDGARSPRQRGEGGQPSGEPRGSLERGSSAGAHRGGARGLSAAARERAATATPLDVQRDQIPTAWLSYFDPTGEVVRGGQAAALDQQSGTLASGSRAAGTYKGLGYMGSESAEFPGITGDKGGASRFYYVAKAGKKERPNVDGVSHPTVKPVALMRWLVRLVTPPGGVVLEPFAGSGTTVEACILEGFDVIAIEREAEYLPLVQARIFRANAVVAEAADVEPDLFTTEETA